MTDRRKIEIMQEISGMIMDYAKDNNSRAIKSLVRLIYCVDNKNDYIEKFGNEVKEQVRDFFECDMTIFNEIFNPTPEKNYYTTIEDAEADREKVYDYIEKAKQTMIECCKQNGGAFVFVDLDDRYSLLEHISDFQFVSMEYYEKSHDLFFTVHLVDDNENTEISFDELNNDQIIIIDILDYIFKNTILK